MTPFRTLLRKELRQHGLAFALLLVVCAAGFAFFVIYGESYGDRGAAYDSYGRFLWFFGSLACLVLGNRLLVSEFSSASQIYLEALPLARWKLVASKYLVGVTVFLPIVAGGFIAATLFGGLSEALDVQFLAILLAKIAGIAAFFYNFTFMMGTFGRYRLFFYGVLFFGFFGGVEYFGWEGDAFPPFALGNEQFAFEREVFPTSDLVWTLLISAGLGLSGFALACLRDGDISRSLGQKMSYREKVFLGCAVLALCTAFVVLDQRKDKQPYKMLGGKEQTHPLASAKTAGPEEEAAALSGYLAGEVGAAAEFLGYPPRAFPKIFTARRRDLDPDYFEPGELPYHEGILSRANYTDPAFSRPAFTAWTLRRCLIASTQERGNRESVRWVLDGFPLWWAFRGQADAHMNFRRRALYATRGAPEAQLLRRWYQTRDAYGIDIAEAVAWSALDALESASGETAVSELVRSALPAVRHLDVRELWVHPTPPVVPPELLAIWKAEQKKSWQTHHSEIEAIPTPSVNAWFDSGKKGRALLRYQFTAPAEKGGLPELRFRFFFQRPFTYPLDPTLIRTVTHPAGSSASQIHATPEDWALGDRLGYTATFTSPVLGCDVISGWKRVTTSF